MTSERFINVYNERQSEIWSRKMEKAKWRIKYSIQVTDFNSAMGGSIDIHSVIM